MFVSKPLECYNNFIEIKKEEIFIMAIEWMLGILLLAMGVFYLLSSSEVRIRHVLESNKG